MPSPTNFVAGYAAKSDVPASAFPCTAPRPAWRALLMRCAAGALALSLAPCVAQAAGEVPPAATTFALAPASQADATPASVPPAAPIAAPPPARNPPPVTLHRIGNPLDATPALKGPAFYLKGNSEPQPASFEAFAELIADKPLDVIVIGASFPNYQKECVIIGALPHVNSCTTLVIGTPEGAQDPAALAAVQQAEIVYFRGGDQCDYVGWQDSAVIEAVEKLVARGGGAGGGSAGLAIQGSLAVYDGCQGSVRSPRALEDPYRDSISFTHDFFSWPYLDNTVTDSHFVERDRMGRLMAFLCRQLAEGRTGDAWGVGIEADTAVLMNRSGMASVYGSAAFVVQADRAPEVCEESAPVSYSGYKVWRLGDGSHYDFANRPTDGYRRIDVEQGVLSANPYEAMP